MLSQKVSADAIEHSTQVTISQDTLNSSNQFEHSLNLCKMKYMIQYDMENGKTLNMLIDEAGKKASMLNVSRKRSLQDYINFYPKTIDEYFHVYRTGGFEFPIIFDNAKSIYDEDVIESWEYQKGLMYPFEHTPTDFYEP